MNFIERLEHNRKQVHLLGKLTNESHLMKSLGTLKGLINEIVNSQYDDQGMRYVVDGLNARFSEKELTFMHLDDVDDLERSPSEAIDASEETGDEPGSYDTAFTDNVHVAGASEREDRLLEEYDYEHAADVVSEVVKVREKFETFVGIVEDGAYGKVSDESNTGRLLKFLHGHVESLKSIEADAPTPKNKEEK